MSKKKRGGGAVRASRRSGGTLRTVGHNVARAEGVEKVTGAARYIDDLGFDGMLYGATVRSTVPSGRIVAVERDPAFDWSGFTFVDHRDIVAPGKNVVAMIADDQPFLAVDRVHHQAEPIALFAHADRARLAEGVAHVQVRYEAAAGAARLRVGVDGAQGDRDPPRRRRRRLRAPRRHHRRGNLPHRRAGAALHRVQRRRRPARRRQRRRRRRHRARLDAVPVLRRARALGLDRPAARQGARRADDHRRRLRRQGRISVAARRPRGAARAQGRPRGQDGLRAPRGSRRHHQAPPVDRPPPHRALQGRRHPRHRRRSAARRRRLRHPQPGGALARRDPRDRAVPRRGRAHPRPRHDDQHAAQRRLSRLRRAAVAVRRRSAHGSHRGRARDRSDRAAQEEPVPHRRRHRHRPAAQGLRRGARGARPRARPPRARDAVAQ